MLRDHIKPLAHHCSGIPRQIQQQLNILSMLKVSNIVGGRQKQLLDNALELYDKLLKQLESYEKLGNDKCPVEREEKAAEIMAHMIIDLAFVHQAIASTGYQIGKFPYDELTDAIFGEKQDAASA